MFKTKYLFLRENIFWTLSSVLIINIVMILRAAEIFLAFFVFNELIKQGINVSQWNAEIIISLSIFVIIYILDPILITIFNFTLRVLFEKITRKIKMDIYSNFFSLKTKDLKKTSKEELLNLITNDYVQYINSLLSYILSFSSSLVAIVAATTFVSLINWILLVSFIGLSIASFLISYISKVLAVKFDIKKSRINQSFLESINKKFKNFIMYINNGYKIPFLSNVFEIIGIRNEKYNVYENKKVLIGIPEIIVNSFSILMIFGILWFSFEGFPNAEQIAIIAIGLTQFSSFKSLFSEINNLAGNRNQYKQFLEKINETLQVFNSDSICLFEGKISSIEFKDVSFEADNKEIIKDLNLAINFGDKLLISGRSGAGKSTIISMIFNELRPSKGKILINNKQIEENTTIANNISFVYNENFIIDGTLNENISFVKNKEINNEKINYLKKRLQIDYIIDEKENIKNLDLSEGQKQKIILARALYFDRDWLILDEAIANIDKVTKNSFEDLLTEFQKTVIFISHTKIDDQDKLFNKKLIFNDDQNKWLLEQKF